MENHTLLQAGGQAAVSDRMRELLARAAQDHVYEQRTQGAVLDEIRQRMEGMEWLLREVRERELGGISATMEAVGGRLEDLTGRPPAWAEGLAQHIEMVRDHVDTVGEKVTPIGELPSLWADVGTMGESVEESLTRLASVTDRLTQMQTGMEAAAARFSRIDKAVTDLTERLDRLEADFTESLTTGLDNVVTRLTATLDQIATRISGVEGQQSASNARLSAISEAQSGAKAQFHALEGQVAGVTARLDRIDARIETADECLADIDTRVTGVEAKLTENGEKLDGTDRAVSALDERLGACVGDSESRLSSKVEALEEQLGERFDGVDDRVESINQRLGQLPATLEIGELHRLVGEIAPLVETRPDREAVREALSTTVEPAHTDLTRRLGALEETMLALAEALLRPTRGSKD